MGLQNPVVLIIFVGMAMLTFLLAVVSIVAVAKSRGTGGALGGLGGLLLACAHGAYLTLSYPLRDLDDTGGADTYFPVLALTFYAIPVMAIHIVIGVGVNMRHQRKAER